MILLHSFLRCTALKVETRLVEINGEKIIESGDCCANKKINLNLNVHRRNSFDLKECNVFYLQVKYYTNILHLSLFTRLFPYYAVCAPKIINMKT